MAVMGTTLHFFATLCMFGMLVYIGLVNRIKDSNHDPNKYILQQPMVHHTRALEQLGNSTRQTTIRSWSPKAVSAAAAATTQAGASARQTRRLAILFTTFSDNARKAQLFRNTIMNWATLLPAIQPLLFTTNTNSNLSVLAERHGWLVVPCPRVNRFGVPFLKAMYAKAYSAEDAQFYAFSNGDILFDDALVNTLGWLNNTSADFSKTTHLLSGQRWNNMLPHCEQMDISSTAQVRRLAAASKLDDPMAEDYFVVTKDFPWHAFKDVVIGRPAYDNYLVARSIELNVSTIDITDTITAFHQCPHVKDRRGLAAENSRFNFEVIGKFKFRTGKTKCMDLHTKYDAQGDLTLISNSGNAFDKCKSLAAT